MGAPALATTSTLGGRLLMRVRTNFATILWKLSSVYDAERQYAEHHEPVDCGRSVPDVRAVAPRPPGALQPRAHTAAPARACPDHRVGLQRRDPLHGPAAAPPGTDGRTEWE